MFSKDPHWGGYYFTPHYFEFWKGHNDRLNKREIFILNNGEWIKKYLSP